MRKRSLSSFFFFLFFISLFTCVFIYLFMGETRPVCREKIHTGRPHTRTDYGTLKKSNVTSFERKKTKNLKLEKNQYLNESKNLQT